MCLVSISYFLGFERISSKIELNFFFFMFRSYYNSLSTCTCPVRSGVFHFVKTTLAGFTSTSNHIPWENYEKCKLHIDVSSALAHCKIAQPSNKIQRKKQAPQDENNSPCHSPTVVICVFCIPILEKELLDTISSFESCQ